MRRLLIITVLFGLLVLPASAQETLLDGGLRLELPDGWTVDETYSQFGILIFSDSTAALDGLLTAIESGTTPAMPEEDYHLLLMTFQPVGPDATPASVLAAETSDIEWEGDPVREETTFQGRPAVRQSGLNRSFQPSAAIPQLDLLYFPADDFALRVTMVSPRPGFEDTFEQIIASIQLDPALVRGAVGFPPVDTALTAADLNAVDLELTQEVSRLDGAFSMQLPAGWLADEYEALAGRVGRLRILSSLTLATVLNSADMPNESLIDGFAGVITIVEVTWLEEPRDPVAVLERFGEAGFAIETTTINGRPAALQRYTTSEELPGVTLYYNTIAIDFDGVIVLQNIGRLNNDEVDALTDIAASIEIDVPAAIEAMAETEAQTDFVERFADERHPTLTTALPGPSQAVGMGSIRTAPVWAPDSQMAAVGTSLGVWLLGRDDLSPRLLYGHRAPVRAVAFNADGTLLASAVDNSLHHDPHPVRVWDVASGDQVLGVATDYVEAIAFSGAQLVGHDGQSTLLVWDLATGAEVGRFELEVRNMRSLHPDGERLVITTRDEGVRVFDLNSGQVMAFATDLPRLHSLAVGPDVYVTITDDDTLRTWDKTTLAVINSQGEGIGSYSAPGFLADGRFFVGRQFYDLATLQPQAELPVGGVPSPDGTRALNAFGSELLLNDVVSGETLAALETLVAGEYLSVTADGALAAVPSSQSGGVWMIDLASASVRQHLDFSASSGFGQDMVLGPDGQTLFVPAADGNLQIIDLRGQQRLHTLTRGSDDSIFRTHLVGTRLITATAFGAIEVWDVTSGEQMAAYQLGPGDARPDHLALGDDYAAISMQSYEATVQVFDLTSGEPVSEFSLDWEDLVYGLAVVGDQVVVASTDVLFFNAADGTLQRQLGLETPGVTALDFTATHIVVGTFDGQILLVHRETSSVEQTLPGQGRIAFVQMVPDGRLVSLDQGRAVRIWELQRSP